MPVRPGELQAAIVAAFPDAEVVVTALVDDGDHYAVTVESVAFRGKSRVEQHRMVNQALGSIIGGSLHAMALTTRARVEDSQ